METSLGLVQIVVLALIQGLTEFLPVSSSAHLILPAALTDWPDQGLAFDVAVHLGSLAAVLVYYRSDLVDFAKSGWRFAVSGRRDDNLDLLLKIAVGTVPIVVAGVLFKASVETHLRSTTVIAVATIVFGLALGLADRRRGDQRTPNYPQAVLIGIAQTLALIPGTSRSGITITAALALGLARPDAARFSFLLAIPAIAGAAAYTAIEAGRTDSLPWLDLGLGCLIAGLSAFFCIAAFIRFLERTGMAPYVVYRLALGLVLLAFFTNAVA